MKEKPFFPVIYMFVITAICSSVLIAFSRLSRDRVEANQELFFEKAVLAVLPIELSEQSANVELHRIFSKQVSTPDNSSAGAYVLRKNGAVLGYALPFEGQGYWAQIKGVIGIQPDRKTIIGLAIHQQNETPGLGAEITKVDFTR